MTHALSTPYTEVSAILGLGLGIIWLRLLATGIRDVCEQAALTVTGYFRRPADPAFERTLREAFTELDAELVTVLADRTRSRPFA